MLKYSSLAGLLGIAYTASFIGKNGVTPDVAPIPATQTCSGTLVLANTLVVAFLCHYNAVQYYRSAKKALRTSLGGRFWRRPDGDCPMASMACIQRWPRRRRPLVFTSPSASTEVPSPPDAVRRDARGGNTRMRLTKITRRSSAAPRSRPSSSPRRCSAARGHLDQTRCRTC